MKGVSIVEDEQVEKISDREFLLFLAEILFKLIKLLAAEAYQRRGVYAGHEYDNLSFSVQKKINCFKR